MLAARCVCCLTAPWMSTSRVSERRLGAMANRLKLESAMATALRKSKSFQKNLFFSIGGIFLLFAVCFSVYQYQREKEYKIDILHSRLQMYNYELMQSLGEQGILCDSLFEVYALPQRHKTFSARWIHGRRKCSSEGTKKMKIRSPKIIPS